MSLKLEIPGMELLRRLREPSLRVHIARERRVLTKIATGAALTDVLRELLIDVESAAGNDIKASILELSCDGKRMYHLAGPSLPAPYCAAIDGAPVAEGVGSCGTAMFRGTPVYVAEIATDPLWKDYREVALESGLRACWSTPIKGMDGAILGTFGVYYDEPRSPRPHDLEAIAAIALTVALAIERHRSEAQLRRAREELKAMGSKVKN